VLYPKDNICKWHKITTDPGTFFVFFGDILEEASGGYYPSTTHRVVIPFHESSNYSRYSLPLFLLPSNEVVLSVKYPPCKFLYLPLDEIGLKDYSLFFSL
jgi:Isopenicillin N synthase and related dioxygenases